jgi:putative transposase
MATLLQARRAYDHRLRDHVCQDRPLPRLQELKIPRSTVASWRSRGPRPVVTIEEFGQDRQQLLDRIEKLKRRERLPAGDDKALLLRAIAGAKPAPSLVLILRIVGIAPSRYHAWRHAAVVCGLDDRTSCPRTTPSQLTGPEVATIKDMVLDASLRHMPLRTLSLFAQRAGKVFVSVTPWARLVREHGWRRPRARVHPAKPTIGVRASSPNQYWHIDVTVLKLLDGTD